MNAQIELTDHFQGWVKIFEIEGDDRDKVLAQAHAKADDTRAKILDPENRQKYLPPRSMRLLIDNKPVWTWHYNEHVH